MKCPHCDVENPDDGDFSFCLNCGGTLDRPKRSILDGDTELSGKEDAATGAGQTAPLAADPSFESDSPFRAEPAQGSSSTFASDVTSGDSPSPGSLPRPPISPPPFMGTLPAGLPPVAPPERPRVEQLPPSDEWRERTAGQGAQAEQPAGARAQGSVPSWLDAQESGPQFRPMQIGVDGIGALPSNDFPYGGFLIRLVAYFIDSVLLGAVAFVLFSLAGISAASGSDAAIVGAMIVTWAVFSLGALAYVTLMPVFLGATFGKLILGYHIVDFEGRHIGFGRALGRAFGYIISGLVLDIGYIWIAVDPRKQGWHDKIAGTYVVKKEFVRK